ncbi:MAG: hypothetical protein CMJ31_11525 [Phycisphaerae bacterium]|nr:hypothetical protein [Phycisphaerae bacterium]
MRWLLFIVATLLIVAPRASGSCLGDPVWTDIGTLPADVEIVIAIENGADELRSPQGRVLGEALLASRLVSAIPDAWDRAAAAMGLDRDALVDEVLGRRLVFAMRAGAGGAPDAWLVSAYVSDAVVTRLELAPRDVVGGVTVSSLDDGRFTVAMLKEKMRGRWVRRLLIADGSADGLLRDALLVRRGDAGVGQLVDEAGFSVISGEQTGGVAALWREPATGRLLGMNIDRSGAGWDARASAVSETESDATAATKLARVTFDEDAFQRWSRRSHVAFVGDLAGQIDSLRSVGARLAPEGDAVAEILTMALRDAVAPIAEVVRTDERSVSVLSLRFERDGTVMTLAGPASNTSGARRADEKATRLVMALTGDGDPNVDFHGKHGLAVRQTEREVQRAPGALGQLFKGKTRIEWCGEPGQSDRAAGGDGHTWWLVRASGAEVATRADAPADEIDCRLAFDGDLRGLNDAFPGQTGREVVAAGVVRPARLVDRFANVAPLQKTVGVVDRVTWSLEPAEVVPGPKGRRFQLRKASASVEIRLDRDPENDPRR